VSTHDTRDTKLTVVVSCSIGRKRYNIRLPHHAATCCSITATANLFVCTYYSFASLLLQTYFPFCMGPL